MDFQPEGRELEGVGQMKELQTPDSAARWILLQQPLISCPKGGTGFGRIETFGD
jgi:hypothetical protein